MLERKVIEEFPRYTITCDGRVFNSTGKELKRQKNIDGYNVVNLYKSDGNKNGYHRRCARLVGLMWKSDTYFEDAVIDHIDMDIDNDHMDNLEWVTIDENNKRSVKLQPSIHRKPSEYSEAMIREICILIQDGVRNCDILKKYEITKDTLLHIRCGNSWSWVSKDYKMTPSRKGVSEATAEWVCHMLVAGHDYNYILEKSTCKYLSRDILKKIKNKKSWTKVSKHILD